MSRDTTLPDPPLLQVALPNGRVPQIPRTLAILPVRKIVCFPASSSRSPSTIPARGNCSRNPCRKNASSHLHPQTGIRRPGRACVDSATSAWPRRCSNSAARTTTRSRPPSASSRASRKKKKSPPSPSCARRSGCSSPVGPEKHRPHLGQALVQELRDHALQYVKATPDLPPSTAGLVESLEDPGQLPTSSPRACPSPARRNRDLLERSTCRGGRGRCSCSFPTSWRSAGSARRSYRDVAAHFTAAQRRSYLREQVRTIQKELGEDGTELQAAELRGRLQARAAPEAVMLQADRELRRLARLAAEQQRIVARRHLCRAPRRVAVGKIDRGQPRPRPRAADPRHATTMTWTR